MTENNLPGYDDWKQGNPNDLTAVEEAVLNAQYDGQQNALRDRIAEVLADERGGLYLADVRRIVIEELNKQAPLPEEPPWQTATPVPVPPLG